jgi:hypothetical protein
MTDDQRGALRQAGVVLDRQLADANADIKPQLDRLERDLKERGQQAWDEYEERVRLIRAATMLDAKGTPRPQ